MALQKAFRDSELENKPFIKKINVLNQDNLKWEDSNLSYKERSELLDYLPEFFIWLNEQIKLGNRHFILGKIPNASEKEDNFPQKTLIFLLVELLQQYSDYSGVAALTIHQALKQALSISYIYTIERNNEIIEVSPCLYPLYHNLCTG
ncbi:hypothetical protein ACQUW5_04780 [Legionella sp. CNM-1927-20]|uniref:hypothetical protein n=1 Tax=Legionella sp. CNM-1927-20 TaxID=3422221 RepID=UPI00403ADEC3